MSKVDIIRKHIGSDDFYDLNGTEMLSKILAAMDEYAQEQVKLFAIPDVSIALSGFMDWLWLNHNILTNADNNKIALKKYLATL